MDIGTAMVLVALIGATPSTIQIFLSRKGRREMREQIDNRAQGIESKVEVVHKDVNGKVADLLAATKKSDMAEGHAAGVEQERSEERGRQGSPNY
jgi:hypothetical protein